MIKNERTFKLMLAIKRLVYAIPDNRLQEFEPTFEEIDRLIGEEIDNAIPIEWIKEKIKELGNTEIEECDAFLYLIDLWRKENERIHN